MLRKAIALDFELLHSQRELHKQWGVRLAPRLSRCLVQAGELCEL